MATSSYSTLFGTTGAGKQGSRAGIGTLFGQQAAPEDETEQQKQQRLQPTQTFAQLQKQGIARPAPQAPQGQPFARFEGSQQAQQARTGMLGALQQQLQQPTRFDTQAFQQIRQAQQANLQSQYEEQQRQLNEDLARRGLSASNIAASGLGRLGGAQARALADIDAQLLQQAAQTQAADRLAALQAAQGFAELAGSQDLAQFEANRVAQAAEFQQGLQGAQFGQQQREFESGQALAAAQAQQAGQESAMERGLREALGLGEIIRGERQQELQAAELTGRLGEAQTIAGQQMGQQQLRDAAARAEALSQQTGLSYTVDASGAVVPQLDAKGQQITTLAARQLGEQTLERQLRERLGEAELTGRLGAQQTLAAQQLEQQRAMQLAELTGTVSVPGPGGTPTQVSTLAAQRLGQEGLQLKMQQMAQLAQQTGQVYEIDRDGNVVPKTVGGQPVRTESALARLSQEELARAELSGSIKVDGVSVPTLAAQRMSQDQVNALRDQALRQSQATGLMYKINEAGTGIEQEMVNGEPVTTEQRRAQQAQEATQQRQLAAQQAEALSQQTGLAYKVGDDGKVVADMDTTTSPPRQRTTVQAQQLKQQGDFQTRQLEQQRDLALIEAGGSIPIMGADGVQMKDAQGNPMFRETVQARQVRQQYENQLAELRGYIEEPGPNGTKVKVDTMAARQLSQQDRQNLAAQALERSQLTGFMYKVGAGGQIVQEFTPDNKPITTAQARQADLDRQLRERLGLAEYTGKIDGEQTIQSQQMQQKLLIDLAGVLAGSSAGVPSDLMTQLMRAFGLTPPPGDNNNNNNNNNPPAGPVVGQLSPDGAYRWTGTGWVLNTPASGPAGEIDQKPPQA